MAVLATIAGTIIGFSFPWNIAVIALILWAGFRLSNFGSQVAVFTAAMALVWNNWMPNRDYDYVDLGLNIAMAIGFMKVIR